MKFCYTILLLFSFYTLQAQNAIDSIAVSSEQQFLQNIEAARLSNDTSRIQQAYTSLTTLYQQQNKYKQAFQMQQQQTALKDSIFKNAATKQLEDTKAMYERDKRDQMLLLQQAQISKQRYIIAGVSISGLLIISLLLLAYRSKQLQQASKLQQAIMLQQDIAAKAIIEAEEKERKRIASDLHDGIGQMLSAVKMNLSGIASRASVKAGPEYDLFTRTIDLVDDSCREVRNVSHDMMPNALLRSGLSSAVKNFIDKIDHSKLKVNLYAEGLDQKLDNNIETVLYRVIQEIVNNVIKHAEANQLDISLMKDKDGFSCTIEDNGKGFDTTKENYDGIGLKNIQTRINYLKGNIEWDSSPNKGTLVAVYVPL